LLLSFVVNKSLSKFTPQSEILGTPLLADTDFKESCRRVLETM